MAFAFSFFTGCGTPPGETGGLYSSDTASSYPSALSDFDTYDTISDSHSAYSSSDYIWEEETSSASPSSALNSSSSTPSSKLAPNSSNPSSVSASSPSYSSSTSDKSYYDTNSKSTSAKISSSKSTSSKTVSFDEPVRNELSVWIVSKGKKYHSSKSCSNMKSPISMTLSEAQATGRTACSKCY